MPNRLIDETSPYLQQHAHNPVDWYPWGPEALERAKAEDKPILLSVGYSACHWCHVMEKESFENPRIAEQMNASFVCIKVDREERPDIDSIYMSAVQAISGHGGWPMTVFLTPEGKPYYGGTYYPPDDRPGRPGFGRVLEVMADTYRNKRGEVLLNTDKLLEQMRAMSAPTLSSNPLTTDLLGQAYRGIAGQFDDKYGGTGMQPKFPQPMTYEFLLRHHLRTGDPQPLAMVELTLERMANGGIYDQLGGGFHRYSTDMFWLVPHFEKMLYDNALLAKLYIHAFQLTRKPIYKRVVESTLDYVLREMTDPSGGFYSSQDADSEGVEGKFFVWRSEEIVSAIGTRDGEIFNHYYDVKPQGNFEGMSILHVSDDAAGLAHEIGMAPEELESLLEHSRARLLDIREKRVHPGRDDKVLTAWNALMVQAFAEAGAVLGRDDYTGAAAKSAGFLLDELRLDGRLLRTYKGGRAKLKGYLEDYSFFVSALIALHEATFEPRWLEAAIELGQQMVDLFWDQPSGQFFDTGRDHEELVLRPKSTSDNAIPAGSSMAADVLLRLAIVTGDSAHESQAVTVLRSAQEMMARYPAGAGHYLCALDFYLSSPKEIAIVGDPSAHETQDLAAEVFRGYLPNRVFLGRAPGGISPASLPLLEGRTQLNGVPTAYVCSNYVCELPVTEPAELAKQLSE